VAALPWNQRRERRAAASTSELDRPAACLNVRLLKPRGALTVETMSAMTVMDRSIKPSAHVKYPAEKDRPRGAGLNLVASWGTWVSESPISSWLTTT